MQNYKFIIKIKRLRSMSTKHRNRMKIRTTGLARNRLAVCSLFGVI